MYMYVLKEKKMLSNTIQLVTKPCFGYLHVHISTLLYTYVLLQILVAGLSRTEERLDSENQVRVEGLSDKVSRLKSVSQVLGLRLTD
jgi:hypothetical protein